MLFGEDPLIVPIHRTQTVHFNIQYLITAMLTGAVQVTRSTGMVSVSLQKE